MKVKWIGLVGQAASGISLHRTSLLIVVTHHIVAWCLPLWSHTLSEAGSNVWLPRTCCRGTYCSSHRFSLICLSWAWREKIAVSRICTSCAFPFRWHPSLQGTSCSSLCCPVISSPTCSTCQLCPCWRDRLRLAHRKWRFHTLRIPPYHTSALTSLA